MKTSVELEILPETLALIKSVEEAFELKETNFCVSQDSFKFNRFFIGGGKTSYGLSLCWIIQLNSPRTLDEINLSNRDLAFYDSCRYKNHFGRPIFEGYGSALFPFLKGCLKMNLKFDLGYAYNEGLKKRLLQYSAHEKVEISQDFPEVYSAYLKQL